MCLALVFWCTLNFEDNTLSRGLFGLKKNWELFCSGSQKDQSVHLIKIIIKKKENRKPAFCSNLVVPWNVETLLKMYLYIWHLTGCVVTVYVNIMDWFFWICDQLIMNSFWSYVIILIHYYLVLSVIIN